MKIGGKKKKRTDGGEESKRDLKLRLSLSDGSPRPEGAGLIDSRLHDLRTTFSARTATGEISPSAPALPHPTLSAGRSPHSMRIVSHRKSPPPQTHGRGSTPAVPRRHLDLGFFRFLSRFFPSAVLLPVRGLHDSSRHSPKDRGVRPNGAIVSSPTSRHPLTVVTLTPLVLTDTPFDHDKCLAPDCRYELAFGDTDPCFHAS